MQQGPLIGARAWRIAGLVVLGTALAGCGGQSAIVVRPPAHHPTTSSSATTTLPPSTAKPKGQKVSIVPSRELRSRQVVEVNASGFSPNESLIITECADKGAATAPGDCNLADALTVTSDANGRVVAQLTVLKGPFGQSHIVCGKPYGCLVSVSQAVPTPSEQADAPITFA